MRIRSGRTASLSSSPGPCPSDASTTRRSVAETLETSCLPATSSTRNSSAFSEPMKSAQNEVSRTLVELPRRRDLLDDALVHDRDPVGHGQGFLLVVRHVDEGRPQLGLDPLQLELHLLPQLDVERPERLVEQERGRAVDERAGEGDALLLAAGELPRLALLEPFEPDDAEHLFDPRALLALVHPLQPHPERDVVPDRHVREERVVLEDHVHVAPVRRHGGDVDAAEQDPPLVGLLEAADHPEGRRLPAAARPEQGEELALLDLDRDGAHRLDAAEALADALEGDPVLAHAWRRV